MLTSTTKKKGRGKEAGKTQRHGNSRYQEQMRKKKVGFMPDLAFNFKKNHLLLIEVPFQAQKQVLDEASDKGSDSL